MEGERCQANNMRLLLIWIGYRAETFIDQIIGYPNSSENSTRYLMVERVAPNL
jgi:hypothetical protein